MFIIAYAHVLRDVHKMQSFKYQVIPLLNIRGLNVTLIRQVFKVGF